MAETKSKINDSLREPKPKKKLGLSVPPPLRMPHEDLIPDRAQSREHAALTPVITPVATPPLAGESTAVLTPVITRPFTELSTGVATPATGSEFTPVMTPAIAPAQTVARRPGVSATRTSETYIDATHRASEQQIYSVMYRETISKGVAERYFGTSELMRKTGIRSDKTVRTALRGLREKLSIEIIAFTYGNPLGPRYRIYGPKEILQRRRNAGIEIDPQSKQILTVVPTGVDTGAIAQVDPGAETYRSAPAFETPVTPVTFTGHYKYIKEDWSGTGQLASSSSKSQAQDRDDDATFYLDSIRQLYEEITLNSWSPADAETAMRGKDVPVEIWGIALCFCIDRAPGNTFQRLAYALEEARTHQENMKQFSLGELRAILKHNLRTLERVRASGAWVRPDPDD